MLGNSERNIYNCPQQWILLRNLDAPLHLGKHYLLLKTLLGEPNIPFIHRHHYLLRWHLTKNKKGWTRKRAKFWWTVLSSANRCSAIRYNCHILLSQMSFVFKWKEEGLAFGVSLLRILSRPSCSNICIDTDIISLKESHSKKILQEVPQSLFFIFELWSKFLQRLKELEMFFFISMVKRRDCFCTIEM